MNILYFLNFYPTKHKLVAHDEMIEMTNRGHRITAISVWGGIEKKTVDLPFKVIFLKNKVKVFRILYLLFKYPVKIIGHVNTLKKYLGLQDALKYLSSYKIFFLIQPDRIHAHFANNAALKGYLLSKFLNIPFSCTGHGSELLLYPEPYLKELILNSKPFITISGYNKKLLIEKYSIPENKIILNYCGVDIEYFNRHALPYPKRFTIVSVTALKKIKGVKYLIDACHILKNKKMSFICNIIGGGEDYSALKNYIDELKLSDNIKLIGDVNPKDIRDYLLKTSVFVLPSLSEGIPVAVMEAMAMGLPVVATDITGLPEIIENGKNGYLVPSADSRAFADKLIELYNNPELRIEMGKEAKKTVGNKFNLKKNVQRFEELIINRCE